MDIFNEVTQMAMAYMIIGYSDYLLSPKEKYLIGWCMSFFFFGNLFLNVFYIILAALTGMICKLIKRRKLKKLRRASPLMKGKSLRFGKKGVGSRRVNPEIVY